MTALFYSSNEQQRISQRRLASTTISPDFPLFGSSQPSLTLLPSMYPQDKVSRVKPQVRNIFVLLCGIVFTGFLVNGFTSLTSGETSYEQITNMHQTGEQVVGVESITESTIGESDSLSGKNVENYSDGSVPDVYVVQPGDTAWMIASTYFPNQDIRKTSSEISDYVGGTLQAGDRIHFREIFNK